MCVVLYMFVYGCECACLCVHVLCAICIVCVWCVCVSISFTSVSILCTQSTTSGGSVTCENTYVNIQELLIGDDFNNGEGGPGGSMTGARVGEGRRRRRSVLRPARRKRQMEQTAPVELEDTRDRTLVSLDTDLTRDDPLPNHPPLFSLLIPSSTLLLSSPLFPLASSFPPFHPPPLLPSLSLPFLTPPSTLPLLPYRAVCRVK